jgi:hypothetical protein
MLVTIVSLLKKEQETAEATSPRKLRNSKQILAQLLSGVSQLTRKLLENWVHNGLVRNLN